VLTDDGVEQTVEGLPDPQDSSGMLMLSDPYSFPTDAALALLCDAAPGVPILGGISSGRTPDGQGAVFCGDEVHESGAVGVRLDGIEMLACVSQGAAPLGREVTITAGEGNVISELAGRPALETVEHIISELSPRERTLVAGGLLIGIVIDGGKPDYQQGDFLVRGVLGADPDSGSLAVSASVRPGQVLRLHARDAQSADEDFRRALRLHVEAMGDKPPAGAIVFSCNGRGSSMFGIPDHDAAAVERELRGAPAAGFFAAGEIGPVGGRSFLHGFTATVAVFPN
jgi:small ligand-binding sensory domain FIST